MQIILCHNMCIPRPSHNIMNYEFFAIFKKIIKMKLKNSQNNYINFTVTYNIIPIVFPTLNSADLLTD